MRPTNSGPPMNGHSGQVYGRPHAGYEQMYETQSGAAEGMAGAMAGSVPGSVPQYVYYAHPGTVSMPQTPFDPVYGVTLLPSHLLIGSPMFGTPQTAGTPVGAMLPRSGSSSIMNLRTPSYSSFYTHGMQPPPPKLRPAPKGRRARRKKDESAHGLNARVRLSSTTTDEEEGENSEYLSRSASRSRSDSASVSASSYSVSASVSASASVPASAGRRSRIDAVDYTSPIRFRYSILPKGSDLYRSRSVLFTDVSADVKISEFQSLVAKNRFIESIYLIKPSSPSSSKDVIDEEGTTLSNQDDERNETLATDGADDACSANGSIISGNSTEPANNSFLLSFLDKESCLDFYNSMLQRYAEIKQGLHSEHLSFRFVKIQDDDWLDELNGKVLSMGASRSLYVELDKNHSELDKDNIWKNLSFLKNSKKYVIVNVDIVNTEEKRKHFGKSYCILHFLSISMAVEVKSLIKSKLETVSKVEFVTSNPSNKQNEIDAARRRSSAISLRKESLPHDSRSQSQASFTSLPLVGETASTSQIDLDDTLTEDLKNGTLDYLSLVVSPSIYGEPTVEEHFTHPTSWVMTKPASVYLQGTAATNFSSSNLSEDVDPLTLTNHDHVPQEMIINDYPYIMEPLMPAQITQTLQNQYAKSIQAVNGGMEHRTVYIGNINPRSKPEDICNVVRGGILQNFKWVPHKRICFVTFIETAAAVQFYANAILEPIILHGNVLKVGWGKNPGPLPKKIALAVTVGASRNVYVSLPDKAFKDKYMVDPDFEEYRSKYKLPSLEQLKEDFSVYGLMEQINFHPDGHCCWVNFMNINSAIKLVDDYNDSKTSHFHDKTEHRYLGLIVGYGKDRCGNVNKNLVSKKTGRNSRIKPTGRSRAQRGGSQGYGNASEATSRSSDSGINLAHGNKIGFDLRRNDDSLNERRFSSLQEPKNFSEGLGITLSPRRPNPLSDEEDDAEDECVESDSEINQHVKDKGSVHSGVQEEESIDSGDESSCSESSSSDVDIIVNAPSPKSDERTGFTHAHSHRHHTHSGHPPHHYHHHHHQQQQPHHHQRQSPYLSNARPRYMSASMLPQHFSQPHEGFPQTPQRFPNGFVPVPQYHGSRHGSVPHNGQRKSASKPIAGSDVMTRYLEQLHHNTFVYAANILGATQDPEFYDEANL